MSERPKPMKRNITTTIDISYLYLAKGHYITVSTDDGRSVEIVRKDDGTLQICADDESFKAGIHRFEEIYGPDPFKEEGNDRNQTH